MFQKDRNRRKFKSSNFVKKIRLVTYDRGKLTYKQPMLKTFTDVIYEWAKKASVGLFQLLPYYEGYMPQLLTLHWAGKASRKLWHSWAICKLRRKKFCEYFFDRVILKTFRSHSSAETVNYDCNFLKKSSHLSHCYSYSLQTLLGKWSICG